MSTLPRPDATLSIVMPVYNEATTIAGVLDSILKLDSGVRNEIVVVDDGSRDDSPAILERYRARGDIRLITQERNQGKGAAIAAGIRATTGDYVIIQDADTEYNPGDIPPLLQKMAQTGALVLYGSRFSGGHRHTGAFLPTVANRVLTFAANVVNNLRLTDVMTCYKLFDGKLIRALPLRSPGFEVEAEITCRIARLGVPIHEAPITYNARTYHEGKKIRARDGWRTLVAIVRYGLFVNPQQ